MAKFNFNELKLTDSADITKVDENFKKVEELAAPIANPTFTGSAKAPNPSTTSNDTSIATTNFVQTLLSTIIGNLANLTTSAKENIVSAINELSAEINSKTSAVTYTATIENSAWSGSTAPYTKEIQVAGILESDNPIIDVVQTGTFSTDKQLLREWLKVTRINTGANKITITANAIPSINIPIQIKVVK